MNADDWMRLDFEIKDALSKSNKCDGQASDGQASAADDNAHIDAALTHMNNCIGEAIKTCVPDKKRLNEKII